MDGETRVCINNSVTVYRYSAEQFIQWKELFSLLYHPKVIDSAVEVICMYSMK